MLIEVPVADGGTAEALLGRREPGPGPGVLVFMDAFGIRPQLEDMVRRIASWGYVVLAPNVFHRLGNVAELAPTGIDMTTPEGRRDAGALCFPRISTVTPERADTDLGSWVDALAAAGATRPMGVVGYCMGARLALRAATGRPEVFAACAGFHGGGLATERPDSPHLTLPEARAEFVFGHADHDESMAPEAVARLGAALAAAGLRATNEVYAGASHGYTMADTSAYDPVADERHWRALRALFDRTLRA